MKKTIFNLILVGLLIIVPVIFVSASAPPPPPPPGGPSGTDIPIGGSAPIGSGLVMLISMGIAYGSKKIYNARKRLEE
jgi:hypothetical protein